MTRLQVDGEFDARQYAPGWTYQRFLQMRLGVLKKLGLKLSADAAKSAGLKEAYVWEIQQQLKVFQKKVKAENLEGLMEKLEKRIAGERPSRHHPSIPGHEGSSTCAAG